MTAGNSSGLNDGAAALLVASERSAAELGLTMGARIVAAAAAGVEPRIMGMGPVPATGNTVELLAAHFFRVNDDGLIVEERMYANPLAMLAQLGVMPGAT